MLQVQINIDMDDEFYDSEMYKFLKLEKAEIDKLKWIESEKKGRDIGICKAVFLWKTYHKEAWEKGLDNS